MTLPSLGEDDEVLSQHVIDFLRDAVRTPLRKDAAYLSVTIPVPNEAPEKFLRLVPRRYGFLWRAPGSAQLAGGGAAAVVSVRGEDRWTTLSRAIPELLDSVETRAFDGKPPRATMVGAAAFAPNVPPIEPWEEFTEDAFVLPEWGYRRHGNDAFLTLTIRRDDLRDETFLSRILEETRTLARTLDYESATSLIERIDIPRSAVHHLPEADWTQYIDAIHEALASGSYKKIVAARRCVIDIVRRPIEDTGFMARLFAAYPDCNHFAIRRELSTFLGATPETLFRKRALELTTHALAGTKRVLDDPSRDSTRDMEALAASEKDRVEHQMVVDKIRADLAPLSTEIKAADRPQTRQVRHLIHLQTPISATLKAETTAFDLLASLHPTPAVGGLPQREAADWIRENEPLERGLYTGTVGWIDSAGDADFAVSIRCGVLHPKRAYIFAGAGVVSASTAAAEYAETGSKMLPVLRALGVNT